MNDKELKLASLISEDPLHFYTETELDQIEEIDAALALRLDRVQVLTSKQPISYDPDAVIELSDIEAALVEVKRILSQDGGDIEFVKVENRTVSVRMKGACAGCPNSALDLKNVVEKIVKTHSPGVESVVNVF